MTSESGCVVRALANSSTNHGVSAAQPEMEVCEQDVVNRSGGCNH